MLLGRCKVDEVAAKRRPLESAAATPDMNPGRIIRRSKKNNRNHDHHDDGAHKNFRPRPSSCLTVTVIVFSTTGVTAT
jgi:hypothetical protein